MSDTPLEAAARRLSAALAPMRFSAPVSHVYNPFDYLCHYHKLLFLQ